MTYLNPVLMAAEEGPDLVNISILNSSIVAILGYMLVFSGLIALMLVVMALGKAFALSAAKKSKKEEAVPAEVPDAAIPQPVAPGAAGQLKLYNVEPKTAAMIMAIVANKMNKPLNELRFLSIKEVE